MPADYVVRPMTREDAADVERLTDEAFYDLSVRTHRPGWPTPERRSPGRSAQWRLRMEHLLRHDPGGCWVAEDGHGLLGVAASLRRDLTWVLATYAVRPGVQGRGVGRQLLDAASSHGSGALRAMVVASEDPLALRRYRLAGFTLHPALLLWGAVPRDVLPVVERVRPGSAGDIDLMNSVDRRVRDAAHGVDHEILTATYPLVVVDRTTGSGYAYVEPGGGPYLLAATNRRTATDLLWETLAASTPGDPVAVSNLTPANEWAVDVGMSCRLELSTHNYLGLRSMRPPAPYIPSGHFL